MWEEIDDRTQRMPVPGGWLVRTVVRQATLDADLVVAVALVFFADPDHLWNVK